MTKSAGPHPEAPSRPLPPGVAEAAAAGDAVALARVLVSIPSVNPRLETGGVGEGAVARQCARWLEGWGFEVAVSEVEPGRSNLVARMGGGAPRVLLNGHLDTVGVGGMTVPPFDAGVSEGRLIGRGACDMKGGVAAILSAAAALSRSGWDEGELLVALTADEEHASLGAMALVEAGLTADLAVVCEPTGLAVAPAHKGFEWVDVEVKGRAAHGSRPDRGVDAIRHAARLLVALDDLEQELSARAPHPLLGHGSLHAGTITGGRAPSVYPDLCSVVLERRLLPGEGAGTAVQEIGELVERVRREALPELEVEVVGGLFRAGTEVPVDHPLVEGLCRALRDRGLPDHVEPMTAWVDAAVFNEAGIPAVCFGPGSIENAHAADEWCPTSEIEIAARVLEDWMRGVMCGEGVGE
jgi:acetylornithine deacetylase